jgi:predicted ester cyclase
MSDSRMNVASWPSDPIERIKAVAAVHYLQHANTQAAMSAISPQVIYHGRPTSPPTLAVWTQRHERFMRGMHDIQTTVLKQIAEGDLVVTYWELRAVHRGDFMAHSATGKPILMKSMCIDRVVGDVVVEHWGVRDLLNVLRQIGAVPMFEPAG